MATSDTNPTDTTSTDPGTSSSSAPPDVTARADYPSEAAPVTKLPAGTPVTVKVPDDIGPEITIFDGSPPRTYKVSGGTVEVLSEHLEIFLGHAPGSVGPDGPGGSL